MVEAEALGATEVCLQGGIHPSFDGDYYLDVIRAVREASATIHIHGFTALEVHEGARRLGEPLASYLQRLMDAGLKTLPGTAAEILDDEVRAMLVPRQDQHRDVARGAPHRPLARSAVQHHHHVRGGRAAGALGPPHRAHPGPAEGDGRVHRVRPAARSSTWRRRSTCSAGPAGDRPIREAVLMHAVGRIAYHGWVPNIQASWVKMGLDGVSQLLRAGVNDLGGTLMDENISRAAGARHGQMMDEAAFRGLADSLGRRLEQRTTLYGRVAADQLKVDRLRFREIDRGRVRDRERGRAESGTGMCNARRRNAS